VQSPVSNSYAEGATLIRGFGTRMQNNFWRTVRATVILVIFAEIGIVEVALAQSVCSEAVDRVENAPFSAQRRVITNPRNPDGASVRTEETQSEARDGKGRTYRAGERRWTSLIGNERVQKSEILVRIFDPVANTSTEWSSSSKEVKVVHWHHKADKARAEPFNPFLDPLALWGSDAQKLGTKTIGGVLAEGFRVSYAVPPAQAKGDEQRVAVRECWYSPELKIVILQTDDDPRNPSFSNQLEDIVRGEPDVTKYQPPEDYVRQNVEIH
jgi:hypothetical protein